MALLMLLLACTGSTGGSNDPPEGDTDTDSDADTDSDTDADSDTDTDTDTDTVTTEPGWKWGGIVGVGAADASFVGTKNDATGMGLITGDVDGTGHKDLLICAPGDLSTDTRAGSKLFVLADGRSVWSMDMPVAELPSIVGTDDYPADCSATIGDVNGDGRADFPMSINTAESTLYLMFGSSTLGSPPRAASDPDVIVTREPTDHPFPVAIAAGGPIGDVDGDGLDDLLAGGPLDNGEVFVLSGATLSGYGVAVPTDAILWVHGEPDLYPGFREAGDVTGDGYADLLAVAYSENGVWLVTGGPGGLPYGATVRDAADVTLDIDPDDHLTFVSTLGDLDGDGTNDFSVDIASGDVDLGAHVFFGGPGIDGHMTPDDAEITFGGGRGAYDGTNLGDIDGDGFNDLAYHARGPAEDEYDDTYVVFGAESWSSVTIDPDADVHVHSNGGWLRVRNDESDVNGDGIRDLLMYEDPTLEGWGNPATAYLDLYVGRSTWADDLQLEDADVRFASETDGSHDPSFAVLDLDLDGFDDVVTSELESDALPLYSGTVYVHFGQPGP
jgi:hypothetical protein